MWGIEASGFMLPNQTSSFFAGSNGSGNPPIYIPVFRADLGREGSVTISDPLLGFAGSVAIHTESQIWGTELNVLRNLYRSNCSRFDLVLGFRQLALEESLTLDTNVQDLIFNVHNMEHDSFITRNYFYGGQIGGKLNYRSGRFFFEGLGTVALGFTHEIVSISGRNIQTGAGGIPVGTFPGGIFTMPSNISQNSRDEFAVVPHAQLKIGWNLTKTLSLNAAYDALYWSDVVRPGNQIDRSINPTQQLGGTLTGPARPEPLFNSSSIWMQGVSLGVELKF
jgi:hypothetical protein